MIFNSHFHSEVDLKVKVSTIVANPLSFFFHHISLVRAENDNLENPAVEEHLLEMTQPAIEDGSAQQ